jgi:hypothetical protein
MNLLYELKNLMTFRKLGQLIMLRKFTDGTKILAKSVYGYDFITINVSGSVFAGGTGTTAVEQSCTITIVFLNEYVQPMRNPGEIKDGEEEGIDYVKTYFSFNKANCPACEDEVEWDLTFSYETDEQIDYYDSEPTNHCVVSQDGGCFGEVIERGSDEDGSYIIWKAFTEGGNQNRSGLGYMQFHAILRNKETQAIVCEFSNTIGVDCCIKDGLQPTDIYWECGTWLPCETDPLEIFGSNLSRVPNTISYLNWSDCAALKGGCPFYAIPEAGGCPPYEWRVLSGPGIIEVTDVLGRSILLSGPADINSQCDDIWLSATDRCGFIDAIKISCCDFADPLTISYTTLAMSCGGTQTFFAVGGCKPYQWTHQGGGSLEDHGNGTATYTAPAVNADCGNNATITLMDCCGMSSEIEIAVNCDAGSDIAFVSYQWVNSGATWACASGTSYRWRLDKYYWHCDGSLHGSSAGVSNVWMAPGKDPHNGGSLCSSGPADGCYDDAICGFFMTDGWGGWGCDGMHGFAASGQVYDCRTAAQKAAGCCPFNPYTGLPM